MGSAELVLAAVGGQPAAFAQANYGLGVVGVEFGNALLPRFAHMAASGLGVEVVRIQIKGKPGHRLEGRNLHNGHVVGRPNAGSGDVDSRAAAHVGYSLADALIKQGLKTGLAQGPSQHKRVPAAYKPSFGLAGCLGGGCKLLHPAQFNACFGHHGLWNLGVCIPAFAHGSGIGNKYYQSPTKMLNPLRAEVAQVGAAMHRRGRGEQQVHGVFRLFFKGFLARALAS